MYPSTYKLHELVNRPDNVKRFIIGRQFCTVLVCFLLAQVSTFPNWSSKGYNEVLFFIVIKSGLVGVLITLSFGQLMPELLAAEYPLRFMNLPPCYPIVYVSLVFDAIGVGHCAWAMYFVFRYFFLDTQAAEARAAGIANTATKPKLVVPRSAELMHSTGSPYGSPRGAHNPLRLNDV